MLVTHYLDSKVIKLGLRLITSIGIFVGGLSVFKGYSLGIPLGDVNINDYFSLKMNTFSWFCYSIPTILICYVYGRAIINDDVKNELKLPFDVILFGALIVFLTESFFIYSVTIELIILFLSSSLINTLEPNDGFRKYQINFFPSILLMAVFAVFYSGSNDLIHLLQFPLMNLENIYAGAQKISFFYLSLLMLIYFLLRWIIIIKMTFNSLKVTRKTIMMLPIFSILFLNGYINYIKKVLDRSPEFSNFWIVLVALCLIGLMSFNKEAENPGLDFVKKSFQLIILLIMSTTMNMVQIMPSFYIASSVLLLTMTFVSILYFEDKPLSILNELKDRGRQSLFLILALAIIILTLSPTPLTPVVFALFENLKQVFISEKIISLFIVVVFCIITFPLIYKIKYFDDYVYNSNKVVNNSLGIMFVWGYIILSFGIIGFK